MRKIDIEKIHFEDESYVFVIFEYWPKYSVKTMTIQQHIERMNKIVNKVYKNMEELNHAML